jgi:hypothetical protein
MTEAEMQKRANLVAAAMLAKGMRAPQATVMLKSEGEPCVHIAWADKNQRYGESYDSFVGVSAEAAFVATEQFVADRPSAEQAKLNEFMSAVGKAIDIGKENGVEVDFLNPLVATMKRLSENVITHDAA